MRGTVGGGVLKQPIHAPRGTLFLLSAALVLLGGYLSLYDAHGRLLSVAIADVLGANLLYQAALVAAIGVLYRWRGNVEDTLVLLAILGLFLVDGTLFQHLYGWAPGDGRNAALLGGGAALVFLVAVSTILRLPLDGRLFLAVLAAAAYVRFAPALLVGVEAVPGSPVTPAYVGLGWLLALLPLTAWLPSASHGPSRLPVLAIERFGILGSVAVATLHFAFAGESFDLRFQLAYLAPLVIVIGPMLEHLWPGLAVVPAARRLLTGLPFVGLALAATSFPPGLLPQRWAQAWPLTPFYLALLFTGLVELARAHKSGSRGRAHVAALLVALATLGGDFPEILTSARFPSLVQLVLVNAVVWMTLRRTRAFLPGTALMAFSSFVSASFLAELGYPWICAYLLALAWGGLAIEAMTRWLMPPALRIASVSVLTVLPVLVALAMPSSWLVIGIAAGQCGLVFALGLLRHDRLLWQLAPAAVLLGAVGYPLALQQRAAVAPARVVTEVGFLLLALGVLKTGWGGSLRGQARRWWSEAARTQRFPAAPAGGAAAGAAAAAPAPSTEP